ncbi:MAG: SDR family NAD(P)-dependent oxidoreductase [Candidatus Ornithospirochaeta sp.]
MKYAAIGGSASGLAEATIFHLRKRGYYIFALDIRNEEKEEDGIHYIRTDLTDNNDIMRAAEIIIRTTDKLDFIASFAGCVILGSLFENAEGKAEKIFSLNFFTTFNFNRVFIPFVVRGRGICAVISSEYGKIAAIPLHGYYPMSKHAVESYADSLRRELKKSGARVTTIRPGAFRTNMQGAVNGQFDTLLSETQLYKEPLRKMKHIMTGELEKAKDPMILGKKLAEIADKKHPRAHYNIKNSLKMKVLTILPSFLQDWIFAVFF